MTSQYRYNSLRNALNTRRICRHNLTWIDGNKAAIVEQKTRFNIATQNARMMIESLRLENPKE